MYLRHAMVIAVAVGGCNAALGLRVDPNDAGDVAHDAGGDGGADAGCRGPGRYQSGKEGSYRPCCPGLTEIFNLAAAETDFPDGGRGHVCTQLPVRDYSCVAGSCGDGICEVGEQDRCGCVADCPDAAWGPASP